MISIVSRIKSNIKLKIFLMLLNTIIRFFIEIKTSIQIKKLDS